MTEKLNVRVLATDEERSIPDIEPLESAKLFWQLSDQLWRQAPVQPIVSSVTFESVLPVVEARGAMHKVLGDIDEELFDLGRTKAIELGGGRQNEKIELSPELLNTPTGAYVGTFNWDQRNTWRYADIDGERQPVSFTDNHTDYHRELFAGFDYTDENRQAIQLTYSMQRIQHTQDRTTSVSMNIWHSQFAQTGYEGSNLKNVFLDVEQELRLLRVFRALGGIHLEAPSA